MPDPLDYEHRGPRDEDAAPPVRPPLNAIPAELDTCITTTDDHGALSVIVRALAAAAIEHITTRDPAPGRTASLYVRAADATKAKTIAAELFARRQKLKAYPRQKPTEIPYTHDRELDGPL